MFREEEDTGDLHNDWVTALRREQERKVGAMLDKASAPKFDPRKKFKEVKFTTLEAHSQLDSYITEARKQAQEIKVRKVEIHSLMAMNFQQRLGATMLARSNSTIKTPQQKDGTVKNPF